MSENCDWHGRALVLETAVKELQKNLAEHKQRLWSSAPLLKQIPLLQNEIKGLRAKLAEYENVPFKLRN